VDCIRQRRPVIHNDYAALPHRKGLPEGHACVRRELVVPILREQKIVAVLGIGNKEQDYTEKDVESVSYFADVAWEITHRKQVEEALEKERSRLQKALDEVKTLRGIIPICASCKQIRDDKGYWRQVERYISDHTDAEFSHGICPECMTKLNPRSAEKKLKDPE
jgi:GAF domain-containing protein